MTTDIEILWALIAGLLLLFANVGAVVLMEGLTRKRSALTVSARHLAGASGAILGTFGVASLESGFVGDSSIIGIDYGSNVQVWLSLCTAVLVTTLSMAGLAERSTVIANLIVGAVTGSLLVPVAASARLPDGFLSSIAFGDRTFIDTAAASLFSLAGVAALVGTMVIGPRRGRVRGTGASRVISGKSMPLAMVGTLLMLLGLVGVLGRPGEPWSKDVLDEAIGLAVGSAVGAVVGVVIGAFLFGRISLVPVLHGSLAGLVTVTGDPQGLTTFSLVFYAASGAILALTVSRYLERVNIDDPVGIVTTFGVPGVWGSLTVGFIGAEQFLAQLLGVGLVIALTFIVTGVVFAILRILRILRINADIEVAGLEL